MQRCGLVVSDWNDHRPICQKAGPPQSAHLIPDIPGPYPDICEALSYSMCLVTTFLVSESMEAIDNPLHEAAKRGNLPFMQECLANGVSVNGLDKAGATPLYWAAHGGHTDCVEALLSVPNISLDSQVSYPMCIQWVLWRARENNHSM